jgi:hypothetical protein
MNKMRLALMCAILGCSTATIAADTETVPNRVSHYEGKQAETIAGSLANLREANAKLKTLLDGALTEDDMHDVHSLSYTLEEALKEIAAEVKELQDVVEDVHLGSEGMQQELVRSKGLDYLQRIEQLLKLK